MNKTSIEWTDFTWNPIRARRRGASVKARSGTFCTRISPGCQNCYASVINKRFGTGLEFTVPNLAEHEYFIDDRILEAPLRRKKPAKIFVGDMFDLFHEAIPSEFLDRVFAVIGLAHWHTFQILTKRAQRMCDYKTCTFANNVAGRIAGHVIAMRHERGDTRVVNPLPHLPPGRVWWPLENEHDGVSVESQKFADERIPVLLQTPAALRCLSVEPMLESVDLRWYVGPTCANCGAALQVDGWEGLEEGVDSKAATLGCGCRYCWHCSDNRGRHEDHNAKCRGEPRISWVICGGESGPHSRPFNLAWAESLLEQCRAAGVPFFMKQIGSQPFWPCTKREDGIQGTIYPPTHKDRKGGDPSEWPEDLRVREFPRAAEPSA